jgi:hypothetical protein
VRIWNRAQLAQDLYLLQRDPDAQDVVAREVTDREDQQQVHQCTRPSIVSMLDGTAMIRTDRSKFRGPFSKEISLELAFSGDRTQVGFGPIDIIIGSGVHAASDGGVGRFC